MAIPTVNSVGAQASSVGAVVPAPGATHTADDIDIILLECADNDTPALATANGFARITALNQTVGPGDGTGTQMSVWWRRWNGTDGDPSFSDAGDHQIARMISISGCITTGDPWDITGTGTTDATADTSASIAGGTTTAADCLILGLICQNLPDTNSIAEFGTPTNGDLANLTERMDTARSVGNGGAIYMVSGEKATAGTFGATTLTTATSALRVCAILALKPPSTTQTLTGSLFSSAPTFFAGTVAADQTVTGTLFASAPTFFAGTIGTADSLSGVLFTSAPTFFTGTVVVDQALTGTLFSSTPTFFAGRVRRVTPPANLLLNEVGVMGHSSVSTIVEWYRTLSTVDMLTLNSQGGIHAEVWGDPTHADYAAAWAALDNFEPVGGFRAFWVMLGFLSSYTQTQAQKEAWADHIYTRLMTDFPTIQYIWWSPMTSMFSINPGDGDAEDLLTHDPWGTNPGGLVEWSGAGLTIEVEWSWDITVYAYQQGYADDFGPWVNLTEDITDPDGRHPSEEAGGDPPPNGQSHGGDILLAFFESGSQGLLGVTFVSTPTFLTGTVGGDSTLTGTLFTSTPSFFAGVVALDPVLTGTLFVNTVTFNPGTVILMVSQTPNATTSNNGWDTTPTPGQPIHVYVATDDSDFITVTV